MNTLLLVTNSMDGSSDTLTRHAALRDLGLFRLNTDLLTDYEICVRPDEFEIRDPSGREVRLSELEACYVRKPWINGAEPWASFPETEQAWVQGQLVRLVRELVNLCRLKGVLRLVEPYATRRLDKLTQMQVARRHFDVPAWEYRLNLRAEPGERITKPLSPEQVETPWRRFVYTEVVEASDLDPRYPWLIQDKAPGSRDTTVVYVAGECFAFRVVRRRDEGGPTDWRQNINTEELDTWEPYELSDALIESCRAFMADVGLLYGRFDFIVEESGRHWFLEVNSNGQYGWLDSDQGELHDVILDAVLDPANTIPFVGKVSEPRGPKRS